MSRSNKLILAAVASCLVLALLGATTCQPNQPTQPFGPNAAFPTSANIDRQQELKQGLNFLGRLDEFDTAEVQQKILYHVKQWSKGQTPDPNWSVDALAKQQGLVTDEQLAPLEFTTYDVQVLQEATWLRDVARTVVEFNQPSPDLQQLIDASTTAVAPEVAGDLAHSIQLFDWTVRNLLLDGEDVSPQTGRSEPIILQAWECLLLGRGTVWEKSRVFILLARQLGLPAVILGVKGEETIKPWLCAVVIGDELFLFDMKLGMPILTEDGSAATLSQVLDSPDTLAAMEKMAGVPSSFTPEQLRADEPSSIVAFIDATPGYLSQRAVLLEKQLMGDDKMVLTVDPTQIGTRLAELNQVNAVGIWEMPYEAFAIRARITERPAAVQWLTSEHGLFDRLTPLMQARLLHLRGQFDSTDDEQGSRALYLECRPSDQMISEITSRLLKEAEGAQLTSEQIDAYRKRVNMVLTRTKQNASFWLGLIAFERGEYKSASEHFRRRLIESYPDSIWGASAKYNLGRCWEAIALRDDDQEMRNQAIETYRSVLDSPWTPACTLRAALLEKDPS